MKRLRIYISGGMTGYPDLNFPAFHAKAAELRAQGLEVVNPAEHEEAQDKPWAEYLRKDIRMLMDCNAIYMLPGWMRSRGALLEHHIASELGFDVMGAEA